MAVTFLWEQKKEEEEEEEGGRWRARERAIAHNNSRASERLLTYPQRTYATPTASGDSTHAHTHTQSIGQGRTGQDRTYDFYVRESSFIKTKRKKRKKRNVQRLILDGT